MRTATDEVRNATDEVRNATDEVHNATDEVRGAMYEVHTAKDELRHLKFKLNTPAQSVLSLNDITPIVVDSQPQLTNTTDSSTQQQPQQQQILDTPIQSSNPILDTQLQQSWNSEVSLKPSSIVLKPGPPTSSIRALNDILGAVPLSRRSTPDDVHSLPRLTSTQKQVITSKELAGDDVDSFWSE